MRDLQILLWMLWSTCLEAIYRPPHIYIQPVIRDIYYKVGESVEIPCIADGIPKPVYTWTYNAGIYTPSANDERVVQLPNQGTIVINRPEDKDEGIYQCFATNEYGTSASVRTNLRQAKLAKFNYEPKKTFTAQAGSALTLPCTPPQSYPLADVYWILKDADGRWQPINFDKRVSMDLEGRLRFTNVKKSDEQMGKSYCCNSINYFMRDNSIGPEQAIIVTGTTEQKFPASELWTSPSDQLALKNSTLTLKCIFSGNPTPDVFWEKINGVFPDRSSFRSFGQEVFILNVQESDAGDYQCMGINIETTQRSTKAIRVRIESAPEWVDKPVSIEASINEKATFLCKAKGDPAPNYEWFINGVPLEGRQNEKGVKDPRIFSNPRFLKPTPNNITLTNLTLQDFMNIQCNASNKNGYVFADVYLNVLAEKPTIIVPPVPELKVAEGQSVIISCQVTGKPDPLITWYRDSSLITGGRFKILPSGNLQIQSVVMADAGGYRCQASNIYALNVTSSVCNMHVRRKTIIEQKPLDLEVIAGYDAKFSCSGSTDFDEASNMRVYWEKDGKSVSTSEQRFFQNYQDNSLTISGTIVRDSGVYTCVVTNGLDESRAYAILTVKDRPDPPSNVVVDRCLDSSANLRWTKGIENNAPVQFFIVQYNTSYNPDQWVTARNVEYTQNTVSIELQPFCNYTFRVIATNKIGASIPSLHTAKICRTNPSPPARNPQNVRSIGDKKGVLKIEWIPMNLLDHYGSGFKYQLIVKERDQPSNTVYNIDNWRNNTVEMLTNKVYAPFLVKIRAKNNVGDSKEDPQEKTLYSFEDFPKKRVDTVVMSTVNATEATVKWNWDTLWLEESGMREAIQGEFRGFRVQYWRSNEKKVTFREVEVPLTTVISRNFAAGRKKRAIQTSSYRLKNLPASSEIQVQVCLINNYYVGPPSDPTTFTTFEGLPGPVQNFEARIRGSNSFNLQWQVPALEDQNGIVLGYDIGYQTVDGLELGAFHDRSEQVSDSKATSAVLSGLLPNTKYRVYIFARSKFGRGEETFIEISTTLKAAVGSPHFDVLEVTENSINITWTPGAYFEAQIVYYVEFRKEGAADWQQSTDEVLRTWKNLNNLERGTYYEIRVVAYDGFNRAYSEVKVVGTVGFAAARVIAANYGWFIGMLISAVICIGIAVFIYYMHKKRKNVQEKPREKSKAKQDDHHERESLNNEYEKDRRYQDEYDDDDDDHHYSKYDDNPRGSKRYDYGDRHDGYDRRSGSDRDPDYNSPDHYDDDYDSDHSSKDHEDQDRDYYKDDDKHHHKDETKTKQRLLRHRRHDDDDDEYNKDHDSARYDGHPDMDIEDHRPHSGDGPYNDEYQ